MLVKSLYNPLNATSAKSAVSAFVDNATVVAFCDIALSVTLPVVCNSPALVIYPLKSISSPNFSHLSVPVVSSNHMYPTLSSSTYQTSPITFPVVCKFDTVATLPFKSKTVPNPAIASLSCLNVAGC